MILGKDVSVFEEMKQNLKSKDDEIISLKNKIKAIEKENQNIKQQRDDFIADCGFVIDYKALNVFSIERVLVKSNSTYGYDREVTNIGYIIEDKILEWSFSCSRITHERLVKEFSEYMRVRNLVKAEES
jgi:hypothetical protein